MKSGLGFEVTDATFGTMLDALAPKKTEQVPVINKKPAQEYNMRVFKKKHDDGTYSLYMEDEGKIWKLKGGDFCGKLNDSHELLIDADDYRDNFYA